MLNPPSVHLSVVIPAYNEESRLQLTLGHAVYYLKSQPYEAEILVVNDGSTDGTERVVSPGRSGSVSLRLINHPDRVNRGKGASVRRGMLGARGAYRLFMDADNSTTLDQVSGFWPFFSEGYDVVIGSRALEGSVIGLHQAKHKELAGQLGNWIIRILAVPGIFDTQAGFKVFTRRSAEAIFPRMTIDRWGSDVEILAIARLHRYRIREAPITWIDAPGSKVRTRSYLEVLSEVWRIRQNLKAGLYK